MMYSRTKRVRDELFKIQKKRGFDSYQKNDVAIFFEDNTEVEKKEFVRIILKLGFEWDTNKQVIKKLLKSDVLFLDASGAILYTSDVAENDYYRANKDLTLTLKDLEEFEKNHTEYFV